MTRIFLLRFATLAATLTLASSAFADVYIRAPFVRVQVGGPGVHVRAPFVNIYVPQSQPPVYLMPPANGSPKFVPPAPEALPTPGKKAQAGKPFPTVPMNPEPELPAPRKVGPEPKPAPPKDPDQAPPAPAVGGLEQVLTLDQFAQRFQPKAGSYEVTMLNPVTNQATTVRFTLPEGTPRRVNASRNQIDFEYGPRQYVRIRFDRDGAEVISR